MRSSYLLFLLAVLLFASCAKLESLGDDDTRIGGLYIDGSGGKGHLRFLLDGDTLHTIGSGSQYRYPYAEGVADAPSRLSIYDSQQKKTLFEGDFVLQKPVDRLNYLEIPGADTLLLRNTQAEEPLPERGYIKLKLANFAVNNDIFNGKPATMVIKQGIDQGNGLFVPEIMSAGDTIRNVGSTFTEEYASIRILNKDEVNASMSTPRLFIYYLDENDNPITKDDATVFTYLLNNQLNWNREDGILNPNDGKWVQTIFTAYINDDFQFLSYMDESAFYNFSETLFRN